MTEFCYRLADEPDKLKTEAQAKVDVMLRKAETLVRTAG